VSSTGSAAFAVATGALLVVGGAAVAGPPIPIIPIVRAATAPHTHIVVPVPRTISRLLHRGVSPRRHVITAGVAAHRAFAPLVSHLPLLVYDDLGTDRSGQFVSPTVTPGKMAHGHLTLDSDSGHFDAAIYVGESAPFDAFYIDSLDTLKQVRSLVDALIQQWAEATSEHA
jgi:hypothetical protein